MTMEKAWFVLEHGSAKGLQVYLEAIDTIKENCVEIVRCKNCIHWIPGRITENDDFIQPRCERNGGGWLSDEYCSNAERREQDA